MYRVIIAGFAFAAIAGCSTSNAPISTGFSDFGSVASHETRAQPRKPTAALGGPSSGNTRVAALTDRAPSGSYETAKGGSLTGRDYSGTQLNLSLALSEINAYRKKNGLKSLRLDPELTAAAKAHSRDLAKWDRISHYGSDGSNPWDRVKRTGYKPRLAAENVGTGQSTFPEVMKGWKDSEGHNKNLLLADADHAGLALVQDPKTEFKTFWTLVLGSKM